MIKDDKPDSVMMPGITTIIYLFRHLHTGIHLPTHCHRASRPQATAYMAFQRARFTRKTVAGIYRELLPHIFTLTRPLRKFGSGGRLFSAALSVSDHS
jgi:hypothetical protein